jgi:thymidylate synthase
MNKADKYFLDTLEEITKKGTWDKNPRPKWKDGSEANSLFITQKFFKYDINKGEFPIITLRPTALKGAFYDIEAIYINQTNIIKEMHPSIHSWWKDFSFESYGQQSIGQTYGAIIKKYALVDKLLRGLEENPFGRRHIIDMFQYRDQGIKPVSLPPCAFNTMWSVREEEYRVYDGEHTSFTCGILDFSKSPSFTPSVIRYIDLTLIQRSMDYLTVASINPAQYVMLGMMVCNHLTFKTGVKHQLGDFSHFVQNVHIYNKHLEAAKYLLEEAQTVNEQPTLALNCEAKDFYDHTIEDFDFNIPKGIKKFPFKLEIAV